MQPFKLSNLFHGQTSLRNTIFSVLIFGVKLLVIHNWFKECWWIASYVFFRAWNFQGYQRNSMWNIQGLIKNTMEFPRDLAQFCGISGVSVFFFWNFQRESKKVKNSRGVSKKYIFNPRLVFFWNSPTHRWQNEKHTKYSVSWM